MARTLKYQQAKIKLLKLVSQNSLVPGNKFPPEKDLVKQFKLSAITVRRAIAELATEGVIETSHGRGSFLIKPIHTIPNKGVIALIDIQEKRSYNLLFSLSQFQERIEDSGFQLRFCPFSKLSSEQVLQEIDGATGVLVTGCLDEQWGDFLKLLPLPLVVIGSYPLSGDLPCVTYDWQSASRLVTDHFIRLGLTRIGLISGAPDYYPSTLIYDGFCDAMAAANLSVKDTDVAWPKVGTAYECAGRFLESGLYDAIVVESGSAYPVLNHAWNYPSNQHPAMGIAGLSERSAVVLAAPQRLVGARFADCAYTRAFDMLLKLYCNSSEATRHDLIAPILDSQAAPAGKGTASQVPVSTKAPT